MAPSSGHISVPNAVKAFKFMVSKTATFFRPKLPQSSANSTVTVEPILIRVPRQPIHPIAVLRQSRLRHQPRWLSTAVRRFASTRATCVPHRSSLPISRVSQIIARSGRAPFASALRPNLTGGCLPRSAGGYSLGSGARAGARYFSHTPAAQAQVVNNVSAAVRAFWFSGHEARFDGIESRTGEKKWKSITRAEDVVSRITSKSIQSKEMKGTSLEFSLVPTITALSPSLESCMMDTLSHAQARTIDGITIDGFASDFSRAVNDLSVILADLKRLSALGDLPISFDNKSIIKVHFPGCDARVVESLCDEFGVRHGTLREDAGWRTDKDAQMALLFPLAPGQSESETDDPVETMFCRDRSGHQLQEQVGWQSMMSTGRSDVIDVRPHLSTRSITSEESRTGTDRAVPEDSLWTLEDGYESGDYEGNEGAGGGFMERARVGSQEYEGVEGMFKLLSKCEGGSHRAATVGSWMQS